MLRGGPTPRQEEGGSAFELLTLSTKLDGHLSSYLSIHPSICHFLYIFTSIDPSIIPSNQLCVHPSVYYSSIHHFFVHACVIYHSIHLSIHSSEHYLIHPSNTTAAFATRTRGRSYSLVHLPIVDVNAHRNKKATNQPTVWEGPIEDLIEHHHPHIFFQFFYDLINMSC